MRYCLFAKSTFLPFDMLTSPTFGKLSGHPAPLQKERGAEVVAAETQFCVSRITPEDVGSVNRFRRNGIKLTQTVVVRMCRAGERLLSELERGKPTVELGKTLQVLKRLGT